MNEKITEKVKSCIVEAVGVKYEDINLHSQLVNDLGADSLDLVELVYNLETHFDISLQRGAIMDRIKEVIPEDEFFDEKGHITSVGIDVIKKEVPELADVEFAENLSFQAVITYFTVEIFVNLIIRALETKKEEVTA